MPIASLSTSSAGFNLSGNDEFKNRSNDVFASLGALEQKDASHERHTASEDTRKRPPDDKSDVDNQPGSSKDSETRQNTFKIPKCVDEPSTSGDGGKKYDYYFRKPPKRDAKKQTPDFRVHPKNWTKYSLTDIKSDQMSDEANKKAALSFLAERQEQQQRETASTSKTEDCGSEKIVFTKPSEKCLEAATAETATSPSPSTSGTRVNANFGAKHVMPEYVVGESKKKKKKKSSNSSLRCDKVNLDHLLDEETE